MKSSPKDSPDDTSLPSGPQTEHDRFALLPFFLRTRIDLFLVLLSLVVVVWFYLQNTRTLEARLFQADAPGKSGDLTTMSWHTLPVVLSGEVVEDVEYPATDTVRFVLRVITPSGWERYLVKLSTLPWEGGNRITAGDTGSFEGTLLCPASVDTLRFLIRMDARCYLRAEAIFAYRSAGGELQGRRALAHDMQTALSNSHALAVLIAMTMGVDDFLGELLSRCFKETGLAHVLVISGFHVGLVYSAAFVVLRRVFARVHAISLFIAAATPASLLALALAAGYTWLCGGELPAVRALIILVVFVLANIFGRHTSAGRNLLLAFLLTQLIWPGSVEQAGCQLTFAALLGIYAVAPAAYAAGAASLPGALRLILQSALISLGAWLGTTPVLIWWFEQFVPLSVLFNVLFVFPLSAVFVGGGLFVLPAAWLKLPGWELAARAVLAIGEQILQLIFALEETVGDVGLGAIRIAPEEAGRLAVCSAVFPLFLGLSCRKFFAKLR